MSTKYAFKIKLKKKDAPFWNMEKGFIEMVVALNTSIPVTSIDFDVVKEALEKRGHKIISIRQERILTCRHCFQQKEGEI